MSIKFRPCRTAAQALSVVARNQSSRYSLHVAANSATGLGNPSNLAHRRPHPIAGAFFVPAVSCYGGCAWEAFGPAGFQVPGLPTCAQLPPIRLVTNVAAPFKLGVPPDEARPRPQSVQQLQSSRSASRHGYVCPSRKLEPSHSTGPLQPAHEQGARLGNRRGCAMKQLRAEPETAGVTSFSGCNLDGQSLFKVNPEVPVSDALEHASCLMDCANKLAVMAACELEDPGAALWAVHYLNEMAKALVDDVTTGVFIASKGAK
jgi:hypothetical protein